MSKFKKYLILLGVILLLLIIQSRNPKIEGPFRGLFGNIVNPVIYYTNSFKSFFVNFTENYILLVDVQKRNKNLIKENERLVFENTMLQEKISEYNRLKKLLNFKEAYNFATIACNVIARNIDHFINFFIIDRGYKDGVKQDDAIISYQGLVGKVIEVFPHSSKVLVILNNNSNVSIMNSRTRTVGILTGDGKGGLFVNYYDRLDKVKKGDLIITSGLGGVYPKGIPVGVVIEKILSDTGVFQKLIVKPNVNFYKLENVLVVKNVEK